MKKLAAVTAVLVCCAAVQAAYQWSSVQIWGGGYIPGVAFHPAEEGLAYIRTDVGGAYRLLADRESWLPLNDMFTQAHDMGSIAIGLDEDDPNMLYVTGGLYLRTAANSWCGSGGAFFRSANRGQTWTRITLNSTTVSGTEASALGEDNRLCLGGNAAHRGTGNRIAVNGNTIYLATDANGLLRSTNRGDTWTTVAPSTFSNTNGVSAVLFDKDGNVYATPFSGGLFRSADGETWTNAGSLSGTVFQMSYSPTDNTIWLTVNTGNPTDHSNMSGGSVHKYDISANALASITMPAKGDKDYGYSGISVNPSDPDQILVATGGWWKGTGTSPLDGSAFIPHEAIFISLDGGATWKDILLNATYNTATAYNAASHNPHWISALAVNPFDPDHVIFGTGYGLWSTFNATAATPNWIFTNRGIEETVPLGLASTKFGAPLVSVLGDIDGFYHATLETPPPARHRLQDGTTEAGTNYDMDYAGQKHEYMVRIYKSSDHVQITRTMGAFSEDGGKTWTSFATAPPSDFLGNGENNFVAVSADGSAIVWNIASHGVYYSTNNGTTWTASATSPALLRGFKPVADRVTPGTFYLYNPSSGIVYRSTDNGANWTAVNTSLAVGGDWGYWAFRLFASPDNAGELWVTQGADGIGGFWFCDGCRGLKRSTDGGETFSDISGLSFVRSIGFGRGSTPESPSIVYAAGISSTNQSGVFRSDNLGGSWTRINTDATMYGEITMVIGDPCVYSRVFLGTSGRGIITGIDASADASCECEDRIDYKSSVNNRSPIRGIARPQITVRGRTLTVASSVDSDLTIRMIDMRGRVRATFNAANGNARITLSRTRVPAGRYMVEVRGANVRQTMPVVVR